MLRQLWQKCANFGIARCVFILAALLLAVLSGYPIGGAISGASDRVILDIVSRTFLHDASDKVAVITYDDATLKKLITNKSSLYCEKLFEQLSSAGAVALEFSMYAHWKMLSDILKKHPRSILMLPTLEFGWHGQPIGPLKNLHQEDINIAHRHITFGHYGVVNGFIPYKSIDDRLYRHAALEALHLAWIDIPVNINDYIEHETNAFSINPMPETTILILHQKGPKEYAYQDVLEGRIPKEAFEGKAVFIGYAGSQYGEGRFRTSSLNNETISRVQLDALIAEALVTNHVIDKVNRIESIPIYIIIALGMILICLYISRPFLHLISLAWTLGMCLGLPLCLLYYRHEWLSIGLLPMLCLLIYTFFTWEHHRRTLRLLRNNIQVLRQGSMTLASPMLEHIHKNKISKKDVDLQEIYGLMRQLSNDISTMKEDVSYDKQILRHIAHDLRHPLTTILALIEKQGENQNTEQVIKDMAFLNNVRHQANYSLRIARDFMQLSRAEQLNPKDFIRVNLTDIVTESIDQILLDAKEKSIHIQENGMEKDLWIKGNADMLVRTMTNVLDNAVKYSPTNTVIRVSMVKCPKEKAFVLHVVDHGIGMAQDTIQHLFEPFFQAVKHRPYDTDKQNIDHGVGLGLAFVKSVIEHHSGQVRVTSTLGKGTDFCLVLPATES